jgi:hypothetical protein
VLCLRDSVIHPNTLGIRYFRDPGWRPPARKSQRIDKTKNTWSKQMEIETCGGFPCQDLDKARLEIISLKGTIRFQKVLLDDAKKALLSSREHRANRNGFIFDRSVKTFVRFLFNGPNILDILQAFPEGKRDHLSRRLETMVNRNENSVYDVSASMGYQDVILNFYTYLDHTNKKLLLAWIRQWEIDRDRENGEIADIEWLQAEQAEYDRNNPDPSLDLDDGIPF